MKSKGVPACTVKASCPAQEWQIRHISAMQEALHLPEFEVEGILWEISIHPNVKDPLTGLQIFLTRHRGGPSAACMATLSLTVIDQQDRSNDRHLENKPHLYEAPGLDSEDSHSWGMKPLSRKDSSSGMLRNDTLVLRTRVSVTLDASSGALDALEVPLLQECQQHLFQCLKQTYMGQNGNRADIMLDVGGQLLPAHRLILENRSAFFKAMFQSQMSESRSGTVEIKGVNAEDMEVILQYLYGTLACIPEAQLQSLLLATDHLQIEDLRERCISQLLRSVTMNTWVRTAVLADRIQHKGLLNGCIALALRVENRSILAKHADLKQLMAQDPDFGFKEISN